MKAIILAAGMGTRLGVLVPKPLTSLENEKTILDFQVEKIGKKVGLNNIIIVVGYKKELLMEKHPDMLYVYNHAYTQTNTAKSLLLALNKVDDDTLWLNGDVFFDERVVDLLIESDKSSLLVDQSKCSDEEIKYTLTPDLYVHELSKKIDKPVGEAVGINLIRKRDLDLFREELERVNDSDYFEKALENLTLSHRLKLRAVNLGKLFCKEIDFESDLDAVRNYILSGKARS